MNFKKGIAFRIGFTVLELMVVVAIAGLLTAIAIPALSRYMKKSKTSEAKINIRKIYDGECAYYLEESVAQAGTVLSKRFLDAGPEPSSVPAGVKVKPNFETTNWLALKFSTDSSVMYRYTATQTGVGTQAAFTARAEGDLDNDSTTSIFERIGTVNSATGEITGGGAVYSDRDFE